LAGICSPRTRPLAVQGAIITEAPGVIVGDCGVVTGSGFGA